MRRRVQLASRVNPLPDTPLPKSSYTSRHQYESMGIFDRFRRRKATSQENTGVEACPSASSEHSGLHGLHEQLHRIEQRLDILSVTPAEIAPPIVKPVLDKLEQHHASSLENHQQIRDRLDRLPEDLRRELEPWLSQIARAKTPMALQQASKEVFRRIGLRVETMIENGLLAIISEHGQIGASDLITQARLRRICQEASVFRHLKKLLATGKIGRRKVGRATYYFILDARREQISTPANGS
jgi:hypothetical protein